MGIPLFQVDAFTDKPFAGNPAAVVFPERMPDDAWLLSVAREMNLSETTFVTAPEAGGDARVRIFTPAVTRRDLMAFQLIPTSLPSLPGDSPER